MGASPNSKNGFNPPRKMNISELKRLAEKTPWVTPGEAAALLAVSRQRVTELLNEGKLEVISFLGTRHVLLSSIIQRLEMRHKNPNNSRTVLQ